MSTRPNKSVARAGSLVLIASMLLGVALAAAGAKPNQAAVPTAGQPIVGQGGFALRLVNAVAAKQPKSNVVLSPASVAGALSVIELGADAKFKANLNDLFGLGKSPTAWIYFDKLRRGFAGSSGTGPLSGGNAIYFDQSTKPYAEAVEALAQNGIKAEIADFANPETLVAINAWVKEHTQGKIPTILDELPKDTGLVALNALYFKDRWKEPFLVTDTRPAPFHLVDGTSADVPFMHAGNRQFGFREDARFVAADLPYATKGFSLVVITTKGTPAAASEFAPMAEWLDGKGFNESTGEIALPRFGASASVDLLPALATTGLKAPSALPGFAPGSLHLAKVQQRVELKVDEEGTEAAAATAITATRSLESGVLKLVVDKPFVFALREAATGQIIVAGYIAKPEALEAETANGAAN